MRIQPLIPILILTGGAATAQLSLFQGSPGQAGDVLVLGTPDERPPELQGIVLLPIECVGRTRLQEFAEASCRRIADVPGAARLQLPREQGSLYRYRRADDTGAVFGYLWIDPQGRPHSLYERHGTGLAGTDDPLGRRVSVSRDGGAMLFATSPAAEGDLFEVEFATGNTVNRTEAIDPQDFQRNGLLLLDTFGVAVSRTGVFRFGRNPFAQAEELAPPGGQPWYGPDLAASADRSTVAFLFGQDEKKALVCVLSSSGPVRQVSSQEMEISGAGYLPEVAGGPTLALSSDGSYVAWRTSSSSREVFVRDTGTGSRPSDLHLSGDATLESTLNDTGVLAFFDTDSLLFAAGRQGSEGVERGDLFRVDLTRGSSSFTIANLTRTSGQTQPPFDYGTLRVSDGVRLVPGAGGALLLHQRRDDKHGFLRWVTPAGSVRSVLEDVESLDTVEIAGSFLVATVTRPAGVDDPLVDRMRLVQIPRDGSAAFDLLLPDGCRLARQVGSRSFDRFAGVLEFDAFESIGRVRLPSIAGLSTSNQGLFFGPTTGLQRDGSFVGTTIIAGFPLVFRWSDADLSVLRFGVSGFLLPGI